MKTLLRGGRLRLFLALIASIAILPVNLSSQEPIESKLLSGIQWRSIGPFAAGALRLSLERLTRTPIISVCPVVESGKLHVWYPIFDKERVASIGALGVANVGSSCKLQCMCRDEGRCGVVGLALSQSCLKASPILADSSVSCWIFGLQGAFDVLPHPNG